MGCGHRGRGQPAPLEQLSRENQGSYRDPLCQGPGIPALRNEPRTCAQEGLLGLEVSGFEHSGQGSGRAGCPSEPHLLFHGRRKWWPPPHRSARGFSERSHARVCSHAPCLFPHPVFVPTRRKFQNLMENSDYFQCPTITWGQKKKMLKSMHRLLLQNAYFQELFEDPSIL